MKNAAVTLRKLAIDGIALLASIALTLGGIWGLTLVDASLFTMVVFSTLMFPMLFSTGVYFGRDVQDATHTLIA
ncbi:Hypothetical protein HDN1F_30370 [gamma proteobacterium HdN1]|nr:Hypothetical protein HDN1F_30370 [gamma proteobacterium HdN1]